MAKKENLYWIGRGTITTQGGKDKPPRVLHYGDKIEAGDLSKERLEHLQEIGKVGPAPVADTPNTATLQAARIKKLEKQLDDLAGVRQERDEAMANLAAVESNLKKANGRNQELQKALANVEAGLPADDAAATRVADLEKQVEDAMAENVRLKSEIDRLNENAVLDSGDGGLDDDDDSLGEGDGAGV